jgi:nucleotide-binding universal stress UspA family protein
MTRFPPKRIVVPFDFSGLSAAAWRQAVALARRFDAALEVVHIQDWPISAELAPLPPPALTPEGKRELIARIQETVGRGSKITIGTGDAVTGILRLARSRRADLIVMGTHGRTGLKRALMGSVAEAVVRRSQVPVLAVRSGSGDIRSILAPVNFTDYSYYGFTYAASLAAALNARVTALHVHVDPIWSGDPVAKLTQFLENLPPALRGSCEAGVETGQDDATRGILKVGAEHDLIVVIAHEKASVKELILGTTAERVLRGSPGSVLVVPIPERPLPLRKDLPTACCAAA